MKYHSKFLSLIAAATVSGLFLTSTVVRAGEETFTIAADSSSGTYRKMLSEIMNVCSTDEFSIVEAKGVTGGAPGNLDALVNNKAQAAFLHSDVYFANAQSDSSYSKFQTLVALYPEPIHVLVLRESKTRGSGFGALSHVDFNSLADLKGFKVGAAGGGVYTARILQGQGEGGFTVVPYDTGAQAIDALNSGEVGALIFVGAAPLPNLEKLNKSAYRLVPIGESIASRVRGVYRDASINYNGLTTGPIKTLAPIATLLTRKYSTASKVAAQRHFRECFLKNVDELKDNGSPNWQSVDPADHGVLPWYDIPAATGKK